MDGRGFKRERSRRSLQGRRCITGGRIFFRGSVFTLKRAVKTLNCVLDRLDEDWIPVEKTWRLNEKHYGMLQGLNKSETAVQYGEEQVHIWRRSYDVAPAPVGKDDPRNPGMDIRYVRCAQIGNFPVSCNPWKRCYWACHALLEMNRPLPGIDV